MAQISTYLNFERNTEEAFTFYKSVFGGEFSGPGISRFRDIPPSPESPPISESDLDLIMHIELDILGCHKIMGTDAPESMGFHLQKGDNIHISIQPDSKEQAREIFDKLSSGGIITMPLQEMFWGAYYGSLKDKFGINWMINFPL